MPISSTEISQMTGMYQGAAMQNIAASHMVGMGGVTGGESAMGQIMNRGSAMSPVASLGMGLAGLDPMSMGLRAGMGAFSGGAGLGGAALVGVGAAAIPAVGLAAASYAGGQMLTGARSQQAFNQSMRQNYFFRNQHGGQGFTSSDLGQMGSQVRAMSDMTGPGGAIHGFEELSRLAANMPQMGFSQHIRSAKEFSQKFKEMISATKEIAKEMGTTLEEAQKTMVGMKQSGVFGMGNQVQMIKTMRQGAQAGGLAMSEVTGMAQVGSQISRMVGGLGASGARGGVEAITQIGVAQQMGALSEEDVYNATGLTGAEGRRAMATRMMEQTGRFLQGSKGRYLLASVAGKDGKLDEESVEEWMSGGMGIGRTKERAGQNLGRVGRANFIRNEGRLRGEVMAKFGALAPAMALKSWAQSRGLNINEMDDRSMLFAQRHLGMGRDEMDSAIKMAQQLPAIMKERELSGQVDEIQQQLAARRQNTGTEGLKRKFDKARHDVQNTLQKVGADIFQHGSEVVERFMNKMTDAYVKTVREDVIRNYEDTFGSGAMADRLRTQMFGKAGGGGGYGLDAIKPGQFDMTSGMEKRNVAAFKAVDEKNFEAAGYYGQVNSQKDLDRVMNHARGVAAAAAGPADSSFVALGSAKAEWLRTQVTKGSIGGMGTDRLRSFSKALQRAGEKDPKMRALEAHYDQASDAEKARIVKSMMEGAGFGGEAEMFAMPDTQGLYGTERFATLSEKHEYIGNKILSAQASAKTGSAEHQRSAERRGGMVGQLAAGILGGGLLSVADMALGGPVSGYFADKATTGLGGFGKEASVAAGQFFDSDEGRKMSDRLFSDDSTVREAQRLQVDQQIKALNDQETRSKRGLDTFTEADRGRQGALKAMGDAADVAKIMAENTSDDARADALKKLAEDRGVSVESLQKSYQLVGGYAMQGKRDAFRQAAEYGGQRARKLLSGVQASGALVGEGGDMRLSDQAAMNISETAGDPRVGGMAERYAKAITARLTKESQMTGMEGNESQDAEAMAAARAAQDDANKISAGASVKEKRAIASALRGQGFDTRDLTREAGIQEQLDRTVGGGFAADRRTQSVAGMLGIGISNKELRKLRGKGAEEAARTLAEKAGFEGGDLKAASTDLTKVLASGKEGTGEAAQLLKQLQGQFAEKQKDQRERQQREKDPLAADSNNQLKAIAKGIDGLPGKLGPIFASAMRAPGSAENAVAAGAMQQGAGS